MVLSVVAQWGNLQMGPCLESSLRHNLYTRGIFSLPWYSLFTLALANKMASRIRTLRSILSELRRSNCEGRKFGELQGVRYILDQYREHQITGQKICRHHQELSHLASTYLCYLNSSRRYKELHADYHGKTKSVEETARLVGFNMPVLHTGTSKKET